MSDSLSTRQKVALCAALGTGVVMGATGLIVYQRLSQNVGLKVTGSDFSQEIASLTTHIERLRKDIECLRGAVNPSIGIFYVTRITIYSVIFMLQSLLKILVNQNPLNLC